MASPEVVDVIDLAKEMQVGIEFEDDPATASILAADALMLLRQTPDFRVRAGNRLIIKAAGGYALKIWDPERGIRVTYRYEQFTAIGACAGIGFVQNLSELLPLQTLFLGINDAHVNERIEEDGETTVTANSLQIPSLVIPVLDINQVQVAA
jgi:hypothetical protein